MKTVFPFSPISWMIKPELMDSICEGWGAPNPPPPNADIPKNGIIPKNNRMKKVVFS